MKDQINQSELEKFVSEQVGAQEQPKSEKINKANIFVIEKKLENMPVPELREIRMTYGDLRKQYIEKGVIGDMGIIEFKKWYDEQGRGNNNNNNFRKAS